MESKPVISRVEVNQRELIYKILSRYSAEFTVFRELLQNADDACATWVRIAIKGDCVTVCNNGKVFAEEDWKRLSSIATGNPNEEAIGFFGVGFYSVFSLSDAPVVSSGNTSMRFFFDGDALYTETTTLPSYQEHTEVKCQLRAGTEALDGKRVSEFLESSISFPRHISEVSLTAGDSFKFEISREVSGATALNINSIQKLNSLFNIQPGFVHSLQITIKENDTSHTSAFTEVACTLSLKDANFGAQLGKAIGKSMPASVPLRLLYPATSESTLFTGKIFIGFSTTQTTGSGFHVSSRFIPTVERDSVDLHSPIIATWNRALSGAAGSLARAFYDQCINLCLPNEQDSLFILHEFKDSSPQVAVSKMLSAAFLQNKPILIPCSIGKQQLLKPSSEVYWLQIPFSNAPHLKLPVISGSLWDAAQTTLRVLESQKRLLRFGVDDLIKSNEKQLFSYSEGAEMLHWLISSKTLLGSQQNWPNLLKKVLQSMRLVRPDKQRTDLLGLGSIVDHTADDVQIYSSVPLPASTLPVELSKMLSQAELNTLGLTAMPFIKWWNYIKTLPTNETLEEKTMSPRLMNCISRFFDMCSPDQKKDINQVLASKKCIPTEKGTLMKPTEVYFKDAPIFSDLPHVALDGISQSFLKFLGVREEPDASLVLDRLGELKWPMEQLVRYFKGRTLSESEWNTLRARVKKGFCIPNPILEAMSLPVIPWRGVLQPDEKSFLELLGVPVNPPLEVILPLCASNPKAMAYFIENFDTLYKANYAASAIQVPFLRVRGGSSLAVPSKCCVKEVPSVFGYQWLDTSAVPEDVAVKLGIPQYPPTEVLKNTIMRNPPRGMAESQKIFAYLKDIAFTPGDYDALRQSPFIFCESINRFVAPRDVFILNPTTQKQFGEILNYVNFGPEANLFLKQCGVKDSPGPDELAENIMNNGTRFTQKLKEPARYISILKTLSQGIAFISEETKAKLKTAKVFVGFTPKGSWDLFNASSCYIVDNKRLADLFSPIEVPRDLGLHELYHAMGSSQLSLAVKVTYKPQGVQKSTLHAKALQQTIRLRSPLLLNNLEGNYGKRENLKEDAAVWCKSCKVVMVDKIVEELRFGNESKSLPASACHQKQTLFLTNDEQSQARWVGKVVAQAILTSPTLDQCAFFSIVLSEPLDALRKRDIPVDRFLPSSAPDILSGKALAAIKIQALFRGYIVRKSIQSKKGVLQSSQDTPTNEQKTKSLRDLMQEERSNPTLYPTHSPTILEASGRASPAKVIGNSDIKNNKVPQSVYVQERIERYQEARARIFGENQIAPQTPPPELESEGEYDSNDDRSYQSDNDSAYSSDQDSRRMRRRDRRHMQDHSESEGSNVGSQRDSESDVSEQSYDTTSEISEPANNWTNEMKNHLLTPAAQGQLYSPGSYSGDPHASSSSHPRVPMRADVPEWIPRTASYTSSSSHTSSPNPLPASQPHQLPPYVVSDSRTRQSTFPSQAVNFAGPSSMAGTIAEDYANLQDNHRKILEQFENLRGQLRVLKSQRDEARKQLAETSTFLHDKKVLIPELNSKLNALQQQIHALTLAHPQLQHLLEPIVTSVAKLCQLSSPHVPLPTPPTRAKQQVPEESENRTIPQDSSPHPRTTRAPRVQAYSKQRAQQQAQQALQQGQQAQQTQTQTQSQQTQVHTQTQTQSQLQETQTPQTTTQVQAQVQSQVQESGKAYSPRKNSNHSRNPRHTKSHASRQQPQAILQTPNQIQFQAQLQVQAQIAHAQVQAQVQAQIIQAQIAQQFIQSPTLQQQPNLKSATKNNYQSTRHQPQSQTQQTTSPFLSQPALPLPTPLTPPPEYQKRHSNKRTYNKSSQKNTQSNSQPQVSSPQVPTAPQISQVSQISVTPQIPLPAPQILQPPQQSHSHSHPRSHPQRSSHTRPATTRTLWQPT